MPGHAEFIHIVTFQAGAAAEAGGKKIVTAEHVLKALEQLEFKGLLEGVRELGEALREGQGKKKKKTGGDMTLEEQIAMQQRLFAEARQQAGADTVGT